MHNHEVVAYQQRSSVLPLASFSFKATWFPSDSAYFLLLSLLGIPAILYSACERPKQFLYSLTKHIHSIQRQIPHQGYQLPWSPYVTLWHEKEEGQMSEALTISSSKQLQDLLLNFSKRLYWFLAPVSIYKGVLLSANHWKCRNRCEDPPSSTL